MPPLLPDREDREPQAVTSIRVSKKMLETLDEIAESEGFSRTEVITHFLRFAIEAYRKEKGEKRR